MTFEKCSVITLLRSKKLFGCSHGLLGATDLNSPSFSGNRRTRNRSRGQNRPAAVKENTIKFEGDFDFESANAQFNREELDKEFKKKLNFKGL